MRDLLLVVPSRGRPQNIARLAAAMDDTCTGDTELVVGLDADDPACDLYPDNVLTDTRLDLRKVTAWCNALAVPRAGEFRFIGHFGDDNVPVTRGWDRQIMEALENTLFAFANDQYPGRAPGTLSCHIFMRAEVVRTLGYFGPPSISHMYVDVAWFAWGLACGISYLHDVLIPHLHYTAGAPHDDTYASSFAGTGADLQAWHAYCRDGSLNADIRKLGGTEFTPEHLNQFNRDLNIPERWG